MCIEDALRTLRDRLAALRLFADSLAQTEEVNPQAFSGLADIIEDLESLARRVKASEDALGVELIGESEPG